MDDDMKRQLVRGVISLLIGMVAAWLTTYLTNKILGEADSSLARQG